MKSYINGKYVEITEEDKIRLELEQAEYEKTNEYKLSKVAELKQKLEETDYVACKIAEGAATIKEYANELQQRQQWREEINRLERSKAQC